MSIRKISQQFFKELSSGSSNFLLGNVGDKIRIETTFAVYTALVSSTDSTVTLNARDGYIGYGWVVDTANRFRDFKVGDTITIRNYITGIYIDDRTIIQKISDNEIQLDADVSGRPAQDVSYQDAISVTTPIKSIRYHFNFIENSAAESFVSPLDGKSEQIFSIKEKAADDTLASKMLPLGSLTWQGGLVGSMTTDFAGGAVDVCSIEGVAIDDGSLNGVYTSTFKVTHWTKIPPYILYAQVDNQLAGIPPDDFITVNKCWRFISKVEAAKIYTDPNFIVSNIFTDELGNTGWDNENFNTGITNYSKNTVTYKNNAGATIDSIELSAAETTVKFKISNATDSPFTESVTQDLATGVVIQFMKVPGDPSEYQNGELPDANFIFDRVKQTVGCTALNGDNYGTSLQVLKDVSIALIDSATIEVTLKIVMGVDAIASFSSSPTPRYILRASTQTYNVATDDVDNDLVTLQIDIQELFTNTTDTTMIVFDSTVALRHPESNPETEGVTPGAVITPGVDPDPLIWTPTYISGAPKLGIKDGTNGKWYGTADYATSLDATMTQLADSVNTNTSLGTVALLGLPFDNSAGFTASWDIPTQTFTLTAPTGSGAVYNGALLQLVFSGGSMGGDAGTVYSFARGSTAVLQGLDVMPEDEIVIFTKFHIDQAGRTSNEILLTKVHAQIIARNGSDEFELDQFILPLTSIGLTGSTQQFDIQKGRAFNVPADSIRKFIEVKRRNDLDSGDNKFFSSSYALMWRWETWVQNLNVDPAFFDISKPNNGFNEWWFRFAQLSGWTLHYKIQVGATKDGALQRYESECLITPHDYSSNAAYTRKRTLTFEADDLALLLSGAGGARQLQSGASIAALINGQVYNLDGNNINYATKKTLVVAVFTKSTAPVGVYVEIKAEVFEKGGPAGLRVYSSKWESDGNSWFTSVDGSNKVVLYAYGNSIIALAYFDPNTPGFPSADKYVSFSSRIYEIGGVLETDDSVPIQTDDGVNIVID